jgi:protein-disulfide isomerase
MEMENGSGAIPGSVFSLKPADPGRVSHCRHQSRRGRHREGVGITYGKGGSMIGEATLSVPLGPQDHTLGPINAPVELVEYGDFQCPSCVKAYPILKRAQKAMNGLMRFGYRNFPMTQQHPDALGAAKAAEAAGMQGRFWQMHDLLYENQEYLDHESLLQYAVELRMDVNRFARDFRGQRVEKKVLWDFETGVRSGVNGTPIFFINGIRYDGDWSYYSLMQTLQAVAAESSAL